MGVSLIFGGQWIQALMLFLEASLNIRTRALRFEPRTR